MFTWTEPLVFTDINPLCALCQPGYTEWSATCVRCDADHIIIGALFGVIIAAFILLCLLHRFPNDLYTPNVSITMYFLQMTLLFFSTQQLPPMIALINLDILPDWKMRTDQDISYVGNNNNK